MSGSPLSLVVVRAIVIAILLRRVSPVIILHIVLSVLLIVVLPALLIVERILRLHLF